MLDHWLNRYDIVKKGLARSNILKRGVGSAGRVLYDRGYNHINSKIHIYYYEYHFPFILSIRPGPGPQPHWIIQPILG